MSVTSLNATLPRPTSPTLFNGTLWGSVEFERKEKRLPGYEEVMDRMHAKCGRRIQSAAVMLDRDVERIERGEKFACKLADKRKADLSSMELLDHMRQSTARSARRTLLRSRDGRVAGNSRSPTLQTSQTDQQLSEAIRETARESLRKDELRKRQEWAQRAVDLVSATHHSAPSFGPHPAPFDPKPPIPRTALLITSRAVQAELRASELEFQRQMAEARKEMAAQQEREQMQRRVEIEEARKRGQVLATDHP